MGEEERKRFSSGVVTHPSFFCLSLATNGNDVILLLMKNSQRIQTVLYSPASIIVFVNAKYSTLDNIRFFGLVISIFHVGGGNHLK